MTRQVRLGKAFEYACFSTLCTCFDNPQTPNINEDSALRNAFNYYNSLTTNEQNKLLRAAIVGVQFLKRLEPHLVIRGNDVTSVKIQDDAAGIGGDVRDILCSKPQLNWQIGISCKHNHDAVKHPRISRTIDFGQKWLNISCSPRYFERINPIFDYLDECEELHMFWRNIPNKEEFIYLPLLNIFKDEMQDLYGAHGEIIPRSLVTYLLGRHDFYKVISNEVSQTTIIQAYNLNGTLNHSASGVLPRTNLPRPHLPSRIIEMDIPIHQSTTLKVVMDHGWSLSFRIHSASSRVEPSLKFDVKLEAIPTSIQSFSETWDI